MRGTKHSELCSWRSPSPAPEITEFTDSPLSGDETSEFISLRRTRFRVKHGKDAEAVFKTWDCLERHDAVAVLVYHRDKDAFIVVRQFRPPVYRAERARREAALATSTDGLSSPASEVPAEAGMTFELVAGLRQDPKLSAAETASAELLEEVGLRVHPDRLEHLSSQVYGVGSAGMVLEVFFAQVGTDDEDSGAGGGLIAEAEWTEPVEVPLADVPELLAASHLRLPGGLMWALQYGHARLTAERHATAAAAPAAVDDARMTQTFVTAAVAAAVGAVVGVWLAARWRCS